MAFHRLHEFPVVYNTYDGDWFGVVWNDATEQIEVYRGEFNTIIVAGQGVRTYTHSTYPGDQANFNPGTQMNYQFCDGTTLNNFFKQLAFPYANKVETLNSPTCNTVVCDLQIQTPITYEAESEAGAEDATIAIDATSSNGPIEYSIDNGSTYQTSNVFTGLGAGTYSIRVKDDAGCEQTAIVTIPEIIPYGEKYRMEYKDRNGDDTQVSIYQAEYEGAVILLGECDDTKQGTSPLIISWKGQGDIKNNAIKGSGAVLNLIARTDFEFVEFFSSNQFEYKVVVEKETDLRWVGYILPENYSESYTNTPYPVSVACGDGLGLLKEIDYLNDAGEEITGLKTGIETIAFCLNKLNLQLDIYEGVNVFEDNFSTTRETFSPDTILTIAEGSNAQIVVYISGDVSADYQVGDSVKLTNADYGVNNNAEVRTVTYVGPNTAIEVNIVHSIDSTGGTLTKNPASNSPLEQVYINPARYYLEDQPFSCYDVIKEILSPLNAQLKQSQGAWHIVPVNAQYTTYNRRKFNYLGEYQSTDTYNGELYLSNARQTPRNVPINKDALMQILPAYKKQEIEFEMGLDNEVIKHGSFTDDDFTLGGDLIGWGGDVFPERRSNEGDGAIAILGSAANIGSAGYIFTDAYAFDNPGFQSDVFLKLSFKYKAIIQDSEVDGDYSQLYWQLKFNYGEDDFYLYLSPGLGWLIGSENVPQNNEIKVDKFNEFKKFELTFPFAFGENGKFTLTLFQGVGNDYTIVETQFADVHLNNLPNNVKPEEKLETVIDNPVPRVNYVPDTITLVHADAPEVANARNMYTGAFRLKSGAQTNTWYREDVSESRSLLSLLALQIIENHKYPSRVITINVRSETEIFPTNIIKDPWSTGKVFFINAMTCDDKLQRYNLESVEIQTEVFADLNQKLLENGLIKLNEDGTIKVLENF